jgi:hypothetical protein
LFRTLKERELGIIFLYSFSAGKFRKCGAKAGKEIKKIPQINFKKRGKNLCFKGRK